jgi:uncharacterized LabA/DUF88 family protein
VPKHERLPIPPPPRAKACYHIRKVRALEVPPPWEKKMQRVALFVDGANMFYAQKDNGWHIDWRLVYHFFTDNKEKAAAYYFTATPPVGDSDNLTKYRRFRTALISMGYNVVDKEVKIIRNADSVIVKTKGNLDIELVFRMLTTVSSYDEVVLMGGDSDYIPIIDHLRALGKTVIVVGRRFSVSTDLINAANKYVELEAIRSRIEKKGEAKIKLGAH